MLKEIIIIAIATTFLGALLVSLNYSKPQQRHKIPEEGIVLIGTLTKDHGDHNEYKWTSYEILEDPKKKIRFDGVHKIDRVIAEKYRFLPKL
jgi:hypothetical protein